MEYQHMVYQSAPDDICARSGMQPIKSVPETCSGLVTSLTLSDGTYQSDGKCHHE
jgi:hypothetical protein